MLICDTHADTLYAMLRKPAEQLDVTLERLTVPRHTRVQCLALFVGVHGLKGDDHDLVERELNSFEMLKQQGWRQIKHLGEALPGHANVMLTIEGGEAFGDNIASVDRFAAIGVRIVAPVWNNDNLLAHSAVGGSAEGLTPFGHQVVTALRQRHIMLDISHLNERGTWELLDSDIPPMASHSCARALCDHPRNLSDAQLRALFAAGGYVGVNFYPRFLTGGEHATIDDVIDHIGHMCALGGERHVGLGSDFDGIELYPDGLHNPSDIDALLDRMSARGFSSSLITAIAGTNFRRFAEQ